MADIEEQFSKVQERVNIQEPLRRELELSQEKIAELRNQVEVLNAQNRELQRAVQEQQKLAETDSRTGLLNKYGFEQRARAIFNIFARSRAKQELRAEPSISLNVVFVDIDHFKRINDTYGHEAGDEALKTVANTLRTTLRDGDLLARWGGEEFVIAFMSKEAGQGFVGENRGIVAEKLRRALEHADFVYEGQHIPITASMGAAKYTPGEQLDDLIRRADEAMYQAKQTGRNRVVVAEMMGEEKAAS